MEANSTDVKVYRGDSVNVTVTATSGDNIVWSGTGTLPAGVTADSADKTLTIKGTVAETAEYKAYTYKVTATNGAGTASVDITITVAEKTADSGTDPSTDPANPHATVTYTLSVDVTPTTLSLNRGRNDRKHFDS